MAGIALKGVMSKAGYVISKHAPEGFMVLGMGGFIGTCILVAKGTKKYEKVKKEDDTKENKMKKAVICYGPAAGVGALSLSCFTGGHYILKKRNVALVAAYKMVDDSFKQYRKNVVEKYGDDEDARLRHSLDVEKVKVTEIDEEGKKHKVTKEEEFIAGDVGPYSFIYDDDHCMATVDDAVYVRDRLVAAENSANAILNGRGYITLNEVLESVGLHQCSAGQIVGWQKKGNGDGYVDFGIRQVRYAKDEGGIAFVLDFNVDGPIYNDIDKYTGRQNWR